MQHTYVSCPSYTYVSCPSPLILAGNGCAKRKHWCIRDCRGISKAAIGIWRPYCIMLTTGSIDIMSVFIQLGSYSTNRTVLTSLPRTLYGNGSHWYALFEFSLPRMPANYLRLVSRLLKRVGGAGERDPGIHHLCMLLNCTADVLSLPGVAVQYLLYGTLPAILCGFYAMYTICVEHFLVLVVLWMYCVKYWETRGYGPLVHVKLLVCGGVHCNGRNNGTHFVPEYCSTVYSVREPL